MTDIALAHFWRNIREILGEKPPSAQQWETICRHFDEAFKDEHDAFAEHFKALYSDQVREDIEVVRGKGNPDELYRRAQALEGELLPHLEHGEAQETQVRDDPRGVRRQLEVTRKLLEGLS